MIRGETQAVDAHIMRLFSRSVRPDRRSNLTERESMLILLLGTTRHIFSKNVVIITDRKYHDQVSIQELGAQQNVTKHVIDPPTVRVSSLIITVVYVI